MIFVTVGTNEAPFDRLLEAVASVGRDEEVVVQHGPSRVRPPGARCVDFLSYEELVSMVRKARVVVTHAGVGSIMTTLANGRRPVVVPRLARHGEAVDDHQVDLGRRLGEAGLVTLVEDPGDLAQAVATARPASDVELGPDPRLVADLRAFLDLNRRR